MVHVLHLVSCVIAIIKYQIKMITLVPTSGYAFTLEVSEWILNHIVSSQRMVTDERDVKELERQMIKYLENPLRESPECKKKREKQSGKG